LPSKEDWSDPELKTEYHRLMTEYEELGHMEPVPISDKKTTCYYLPHHPGLEKAALLPKFSSCSMEVLSPPLDYHSMTYEGESIIIRNAVVFVSVGSTVIFACIARHDFLLITTVQV
jgi:hypothetical protein